MSQQQPPAGWYTLPDGAQLYWDGSRWLNQDGSAAGATATAKNGGLSTRTWVLIGIGAGVVIGGFGLLASLGENDTQDPASSSVAATASPSEEEPTPTPTPTRSTAAPTREATPTPPPTPKSYPQIDERTWALIAKNPDAHVGETYLVFGEVTQFDSATGQDAFRANVAASNTCNYGFFDGDNTILTAAPGVSLDNVVTDDVFAAQVTVMGSYSYDTQIGGNTTVPALIVDTIEVQGTCTY